MRGQGSLRLSPGPPGAKGRWLCPPIITEMAPSSMLSALYPAGSSVLICASRLAAGRLAGGAPGVPSALAPRGLTSAPAFLPFCGNEHGIWAWLDGQVVWAVPPSSLGPCRSNSVLTGAAGSKGHLVPATWGTGPGPPVLRAHPVTVTHTGGGHPGAGDPAGGVGVRAQGQAPPTGRRQGLGSSRSGPGKG